jgi:hypothetical protein
MWTRFLFHYVSAWDDVIADMVEPGWRGGLVTGFYDQKIVVRFPAGGRNFALVRNVETDYGAPQAPYSMGMICDGYWGIFFWEGKVAVTWSGLLTTITAEVNNACNYTSISPRAYLLRSLRHLRHGWAGGFTRWSVRVGPGIMQSCYSVFVDSMDQR